MSLNKTNIEWCDRTWNPVTGCLHGCSYCYARKIAERFKGSKAWPEGFKPTFHPERLNDPQREKNPQSIFVCSMADLFGSWVFSIWQEEIFDSCMKSPNHTYLFLTKNPIDIVAFDKDFPEYTRQNNHWFGVSVTGKNTVHFIETLKRANVNRFISFEPLLSDPGELDLTGIKQVIIGAQTKPTVIPPGDAIRRIVRSARESGTKVFFKDSMNGVRWMGESTFVNNHDLCWKVNK